MSTHANKQIHYLVQQQVPAVNWRQQVLVLSVGERKIAEVALKSTQTHALSHCLRLNTYSMSYAHTHTSSYLYCWWSLVLRVLAMNLSASFSRFLEYSVSISAFFLKKSCRSCSSCTLISVCCSKHRCCSTSWARTSTHRYTYNQIYTVYTQAGIYTHTIIEMHTTHPQRHTVNPIKHVYTLPCMDTELHAHTLNQTSTDKHNHSVTQTSLVIHTH